MRLAFIVGDLAMGGASTALLNLAAELGARGHDIRLFALTHLCDYDSDIAALGLNFTRQDDRRLIFEDCVKNILSGLARFRPDAVIAWLGEGPLEILRYVPDRVTRLAVIHCDHWIFYDAVRPFRHCVDGLMAVSQAIADRLRGMPDFLLNAVHYVPNGIPFRTPPRADPPNLDRPLRILYFGRLIHPQKRVRLFPQIMAALTAAGVPFDWVIAGEGEERAWLEENMRSTSPAQTVRFLDTIAYHEVPQLLADRDIFLLASESEGLPMSLLEAMGHGVVPVASALESGIREVVNETNGVPVPPDDTDGYARAIIHLHTHRDELQAKSLAATATARTEFSVEKMADCWLAGLENAPKPRVPWRAAVKVRAPLRDRHPWKYAPLLRPFRRLAKRLSA